ncbi:MAG: 3-hydroxyacyl-CoA dehydrogenase family protein [Ilumatobacteraceae bacterium]
MTSPERTASTLQIGVVGSGIMGAGLAEMAARSGFDVIVRSRTAAAAAAMVSTIERGLTRAVERGRLTNDEQTTALSHIRTTERLEDLADCDLVIESVVEDLAVKRGLFADLDRITAPDAVLVTNTSTLPVIEMAIATQHPERICGLHFFNPVTAMRLVELVRPLTASDDTLARARRFAEACGKDVVEVDDRAGFVVNALLFPYLNDAVRMLDRGTASMNDIDAAMRGGCNFPMGPFELLDLVGIDTSVAILDALYGEFRESHYAAHPVLRRMVAAGRLGRKTGRGFHEYR